MQGEWLDHLTIDWVNREKCKDWNDSEINQQMPNISVLSPQKYFHIRTPGTLNHQHLLYRDSNQMNTTSLPAPTLSHEVLATIS